MKSNNPRFKNANELMKYLYEEKCGVKEDENLYDDINKEEIQALIDTSFLRKLVFKPKKTKVGL